MSINERIKALRKQLNLTMDEFSKPLGVGKSAIANIESGIRVPSDRTVSDICREFDVSETWLRTGTGDMFNPKTRGEEIGAIVKSAARHDPEQAAAFMQSLVSDLSDAEIVLLYEIFRRHFPGAEKKPSPSVEGARRSRDG